MSEPYLILHKVRGEPAFDIAIKTICPICQGTGNKQIGIHTGEDCDCHMGYTWLIPTSGHGAYPYHMWPLLDLAFDMNILDGGDRCYLRQLDENTLRCPKDWPDHYSCNDRSAKPDLYEVKAKATGLLQSLGLVKKVEVERRF